jgi:hypothetical protein
VETLQSSDCRRARDIVERVLEAEDEFAAGAAQRDDMTLWVGRVDEVASKLVLRVSECEEPAAA